MDKKESCEVREAEERTPLDINLSVYGMTTDGTASEKHSDDEDDDDSHLLINDKDAMYPIDNLFNLSEGEERRRTTARFGSSGGTIRKNQRSSLKSSFKTKKI